MIINEEKFKEINYKFCSDIQDLFVKLLNDLSSSGCIDDGVANEAIYSLGDNVASCIYNVCEDKELAMLVKDEVYDCIDETLEVLYSPEKDKKIAMLGDNVICND